MTTSSESAARWAVTVAASTPLLSAVTAVALADRERATQLMRRWCEVERRIFGLELEVEDHNHGRYDDPPYLFVHLNQASLAETFVKASMIPIPFRLILNVEYALLPGIGPACVALGGRVIVRQWPAQAKRQIDRAVEDMKRGDSYLMSVEGRRSPDGAIQPYKRGAAVLAIRSGATVVPFLTLGARERMPYGEWRVRPGVVRGVLLEAISTRGMTLEDRFGLTRRLERIAATTTANRPAGNRTASERRPNP